MKVIEKEEKRSLNRDHVSSIVEAWHRERPELQTSSMEVLGRIGRIALLADRELRRTIASYGLTSGTFNVLASLRRAGGDHCMHPSDLTASLWVTSGAVSKRIDKLEKMGLVTRSTHASDRRSITVCLTENGRKIIDEAMERHLENGATALSSVLVAEEMEQLTELLCRLLRSIEDRMDENRQYLNDLPGPRY